MPKSNSLTVCAMFLRHVVSALTVNFTTFSSSCLYLVTYLPAEVCTLTASDLLARAATQAV